MKIVIPAIIYFLILPLSAFAQGDDAFYESLLDRHAKMGQITKKEATRQKFEWENSKKYQDQFKDTARGVASKFQNNRTSLKFVNPEIEISAE